MTWPHGEADLSALLAAAGSSLASLCETDAYCVVLSWGDQEGAEVVHREHVPDALARALGSAGGRYVSEAARRSAGPLRLRRDTLPPQARELRAAMDESGYDRLAVFQLVGEAGTCGFAVVPLEGGNPVGEPDPSHWQLTCRVPLGLQLAAASGALQVALELEESRPAEALEGILVLDRWERVVFVDGLFLRFPGWNRGSPFGRSLDNLPGTRTLTSLEPSPFASLAWSEHLLPPTPEHGIPVSLAAISADELGEGGFRMVLLRDLRAHRTPASSGPQQLLNLGMRIAHVADELGRSLAVAGRRDAAGLPALLMDKLEEDVREAELHVTDVLRRCAVPDARRSALVNELAREVLARYESELAIDRIRVFTLLRPDLPAAATDSLAVMRVLRILVQEARESLRSSGGSLTARTWCEDRWVCITISDDGAGRRGHDEERVGEPLFANVDADVRRDHLSLARMITESAGGKLIVESRPGVWSRSTLMLEMAPEPASTTPSSNDGTGIGGPESLSILVVDDNPALRSVLRRYLERAGHQVTEAENGEDALRILRVREFDRAIVDLRMPVKSGPELYESLAGVAPAMRQRVIFMTGGFTEGATEEFIAETGRPWIKKPFDLAEMARVVESAGG